MKKIFLILLILNLNILSVNAMGVEKKEVTLVNCEDALTSWINVDGEKKIIRLIATDTSDGSLNTSIDSYVCNKFKNAKKIEIEFDSKFNELDEYNRLNVWVYIDGKLLQKDLIEKGYAQVNYIKDDYMYLEELCEIQKEAIKEKLGIWKYPNQEEKYCQSGINLEADSFIEIEDDENNSNNNNSNLFELLCINVLIVILVLLIGIKRRKNG